MRPKSIHLLLACTLVAIASAGCTCSSPTTQVLEELDQALEQRNIYTQAKQRHIDELKQLYDSCTSPEQQYSIAAKIAEEYRTYQLDSTLVWKAITAQKAEQMNYPNGQQAARLEMVELYATAGFYAEAEALFNSFDTTALAPELEKNFCRAAHAYHREMREYSISNSVKEASRKAENYYINRLVELAESQSERQQMLCFKYVNSNQMDKAAEQIDLLLPTLKPDEHDFAVNSYLKACTVADNEELYIEHLARSAITDLRTATTDNASICVLAQTLFHQGDVDRAFKYISAAIDDALFFNSRLRPWQIALSLPVIQRAYHHKLQRQNTIATTMVVISVAMLVVVIVLLMQKGRQHKLIRQTKYELEQLNSDLNAYVAKLTEQNEKQNNLIDQLYEANAVKEQYIGLFLMIGSNYIDRLKDYQRLVRKRLNNGAVNELKQEVSQSTLVDDAMEEFYATFDNAFLSLYPTFVDDFNALLRDEEQITLKNDGQLNTELRIFALIRLGITDSSRIASLLRYSVNTIYNYRAAVKNRAKISRENFEEQIKQISNFKKI